MPFWVFFLHDYEFKRKIVALLNKSYKSKHTVDLLCLFYLKSNMKISQLVQCFFGNWNYPITKNVRTIHEIQWKLAFFHVSSSHAIFGIDEK